MKRPASTPTAPRRPPNPMPAFCATMGDEDDLAGDSAEAAGSKNLDEDEGEEEEKEMGDSEDEEEEKARSGCTHHISLLVGP